jgi:hypothetical protein
MDVKIAYKMIFYDLTLYLWISFYGWKQQENAKLLVIDVLIAMSGMVSLYGLAEWKNSLNMDEM